MAAQNSTVFTVLGPAMSAMPIPQPIWDRELVALQVPAAEWILPGYIARRNVTLLTGVAKFGKTTFLTQLLTRRKNGGTLAGLSVPPGKTVVITEESQPLWAERARRHDFGGHVCFFAQPFRHLPSADEWQALVDKVAEVHDQQGADLLILDPLIQVLTNENNAASVLKIFLPLRALTARGMGVAVAHHPVKRGGVIGQLGRGHGVLHSHIDISIEMHAVACDPDSRARRLYCKSRFAESPRSKLLEWNADGTDYNVLPDAGDEDFHQHWDVLRMVLEDVPQKVTRHDILDEWPDDFPKPSSATLWRWLNKALADGLIVTEGTGRKADPYRYWLPNSEERWRAEQPLYDLFAKQERDLKLPFVSLREKRRSRAESEDWDRPLKRGEKLWPPGAEEE